MIKINIKPKTVRAFARGLKPGILEVIDFYRSVFTGLQTNNFNSINASAINGNTKNALLKAILAPNNEITGSNQYTELANPGFVDHAFTRINARLYITFLNNLQNLIPQLLVAPPLQLKKINNDLANQINAPEAVKKLLTKILPYESFIKGELNYTGHQFAKALDISVCPYCNRNYITSVSGKNNKKIIGPSFDHFFDKDRYPFLRLSLYNLIPSCTICNSNLKHTTNFDLSNHLHPYLDEFGADAYFIYRVAGIGKYKIRLNAGKTITSAKSRRIFGAKNKPSFKKGNAIVFEIEKIYNSAHQDIIHELHTKTDSNSIYYAISILNTFPLMKTNLRDFYQYYFGNYYSNSDHSRRPLAKLTHDLVRQRLPHHFNF